MSRHLDIDKIVKAIPKVPAQVGQVTAFIATLVGFIRLWQQGPEIVGIIMLVLGASVICLLLAYVAYSKVPPLIVGGSEKWRFPRWRIYAMVGLVAVPILAVGSLTLSLLRDHTGQASRGEPTMEARQAAAQLTDTTPASAPAASLAPTHTQPPLPTASPTATKRPTPVNAYTILLADFSGPEPEKHRVTEAIQEQLLLALPEDAAILVRLGRSID